MISRGSPPAALVILTASCSCGASSPPIEPSATVAAAPSTPAFEVHDWGLVRGTAADTIMISGPHAPEPPMVVTKPVLYFHREAERDGLEALIVDVDARIPDGRIVEHWPTMGGDPGSVASWHGVVLQSGSCPGSRYPSLAEDPLFGERHRRLRRDDALGRHHDADRTAAAHDRGAVHPSAGRSGRDR